MFFSKEGSGTFAKPIERDAAAAAVPSAPSTPSPFSFNFGVRRHPHSETLIETDIDVFLKGFQDCSVIRKE